MDNPLSRLVPQLFGEYPKPFINLVENISLGPNQNVEEIEHLLWKAYEFGNRHHEGQKRLSGQPYFTHCVAVANTLAVWKMDTTTIIAGLLHDTVEDTNATLDEIIQILVFCNHSFHLVYVGNKKIHLHKFHLFLNDFVLNHGFD